jgi:large subunit ribosomal protein L4
VLFVDQLNTYDVLCSDDVVFTQSALTAFIDGTASSSGTPAAAAQEDTK